MKKLIINSENSHLNDDNTVDVPAKSFSKKKIALLGASVVLIICIAVFVGNKMTHKSGIYQWAAGNCCILVRLIHHFKSTAASC